MSSLVIYPTRGFLNTVFKIKSSQNDTFKITFNGINVSEGKLTKGETVSLPKLHASGDYIIESIKSGERQTIRVEDAIRLGSSDLKKSYVFDNFPYIVFVMKDRIHLYDPIIGTYVYTENYLSPNNVQDIDETKLLFSTEHENGITISVFDINALSIIEEKEYKKIIAYSQDISRLYVLNENSDSICVINTRNLSIIETIHLSENKGLHNYKFDTEKGLLYMISDSFVNCIDIYSGNKKRIEIENAIGITKNGYLIKNSRENIYDYEDLCPSSIIKGCFRYKSFGIRKFVGFSIKNDEWQNEVKKSIAEVVSDYELECERKISSGEKPEILKELDLVENRLSLDICPSDKGVYIVEESEEIKATCLRYFHDTKRVSGVTSTRSIKLLWKSKSGYEISYKSANYGYCLGTLCLNENLASFALNSTEFVVINYGEITDKFESQSEAKKKVQPLKESVNEVKIIIDREEISTNKIVCKSNCKLICKSGNFYKYYIRDNSKQDWAESKIIELEEEKHSRAKMSLDGKYIVYSKGGNKYALYDINKQSEETILTGNFVDFDKSGNLMFMEDAKGCPARFREVKIFNPITFKWEKGTPEYYNFLSPDGKLYAKTALNVRYFDLMKDEEINRESYNQFASSVDRSYYIKYNAEEIENLKKKRQEIVSNNKDYFRMYAVENSYKDSWIDDIQDPNKHYNFSTYCHKSKQYTVIGIVKTNTEIELEVGNPLSFLNYVSFSYDNKYVGIVGKPEYGGYLKLSKICFNESENSLRLEKDICDMKIANKATWICAFTKQGLFGTYDSNPNLYLIEEDSFVQFNNENVNDFTFLRKHFMIPDRSLLCFSPSGKYMALSNQGYEAKSLGGKGHIPSNEVFIYTTSSKELLTSWNDQGDAIAFRNVANAGFSIDDTKLMTVSVDGVIVVRNIQEVIAKNNRLLSIAS